MLRAVLWSAIVVSMAWATALLWLTGQLAEQVGRVEIDLRYARKASQAALAELAAAEAATAAARQRCQELETQLVVATQQREAMAAVVQQRIEQERERLQAAAAAAERLRAPMPEGVRLCLAALHECLRLEGYALVRFLNARALDAEGLHHVEALVTHPDGLGVELLSAARMQAKVDRAEGRLRLVFLDGELRRNGEVHPLPEAGHELRFAPIDGQLFEQRLPALVEGLGDYPAGASNRADRTQRKPGELDPLRRQQWLERFDRLLGQAGTAESLRLNRLQGLRELWFEEVQILGTDSKNLLAMSADCQRLAVEIDAAAGTVSLWLRDGSLRRGDTESTISAAGFRMLLPKISPQQAREIMLGMVVDR
jgi:hypothetical protein